MFLRRERPLALLLQLAGLCLIAYDLLGAYPQVAGWAALLGCMVFVIGGLLSRQQL